MKALHVPSRPIRVLTAAALFDGHDAAINIIRRILQGQGAEVIHLGHNRSVQEIVTACLQEDVDAVAVSSYQGGHIEFFTYLVSSLRDQGLQRVRVYGGGGGTIVEDEVTHLERLGVAHIFTPQDGQQLGLAAMVNTIIRECDVPLPTASTRLEELANGDVGALAAVITDLERGALDPLALLDAVTESSGVVLGITGTGGAGKSSLSDELLRRLVIDQDDSVRVAVLAIDPTRRKAGGALLGDRIRMNSLADGRVFFRSLATRGSPNEVPQSMRSIIAACKLAGFNLIVVETPGIGQGDSGIVDMVDLSLYVMTSDFGAASQLEKIDMLDFADVVAINKFERRGSEDARREVARQLLRNRHEFHAEWEDMPVFGTSAASFDDDGVTALYQFLRQSLAARGLSVQPGRLATIEGKVSTGLWNPIPAERVRYLAEIADCVRNYHQRTNELVALVRERDLYSQAAAVLPANDAVLGSLAAVRDAAELAIDDVTKQALAAWPATVERYSERRRMSLSGSAIPRVALPSIDEGAALLRFLRRENLPGAFPFTAGVFPFKREDEDLTRMFAGEGDAVRTNRRFHLLSQGQPATRLSTAFDSVTLYGRDPDLRPDIYGKVGTSGVSIATLEDMRLLFAGFDLCSPSTSVSMTINGPAPTILAFFLNAAIDQQVEKFVEREGRHPGPHERAALEAFTFANVRGTVQADILKEDQGQNTCLFSTEFSLRMMADVEKWFIEHAVRRFYSVSISGYHIAEAGANPISQLAFTLANAFTYVELYRARGMQVDDFAPNLSFFFSNGMDAEYTVLGRVARRIWAIAMRDCYGANERAQKLKYHVQTSGRSLHAQEMSFNDIRTTLQALNAVYDNANSLHTNAFDEAVTTPTAESVRRALAIQLIINREWGLAMNENPLQGSFVVDQLTDLVEAAVLAEFDRLTERGGVLGAMETGYQRGRIQDESMRYEQGKHDGTLPIIGVNTFLAPMSKGGSPPHFELARGTAEEKASQLARLSRFHHDNAAESQIAIQRLQASAARGENLFDELMHAARVCSLGQLTEAFFAMGGQYRRNV